MDRSGRFWLAFFVALALAVILLTLCRSALRRFEFSKRDMKASGLNRRERRRFAARRKNARRRRKMRF